MFLGLTSRCTEPLPRVSVLTLLFFEYWIRSQSPFPAVVGDLGRSPKNHAQSFIK
jgi:hypothetical protein